MEAIKEAIQLLTQIRPTQPPQNKLRITQVVNKLKQLNEKG